MSFEALLNKIHLGKNLLGYQHLKEPREKCKSGGDEKAPCQYTRNLVEKAKIFGSLGPLDLLRLWPRSALAVTGLCGVNQ